MGFHLIIRTDINPMSDILNIQNVLNRAMIAMDNGDEDMFASCFTPNASIDIVVAGLSKSGSESIKELARNIHKRFSPCQHWEGNICVT